MTADTEVYYDPYDFEIDNDPYPVWRRLREEAPLYYNEQVRLLRAEPLRRRRGRASPTGRPTAPPRGCCSRSSRRSSSTAVELPPGNVLFEDPPIHDVHRGILSRVFTPKRMLAIEPKVREFCAQTLDPLVGSGGFDFITDLGAQMPMRTIGMLLGIPESDQEAIREAIDASLALDEGGHPQAAADRRARRTPKGCSASTSTGGRRTRPTT